MDVDQVVAAYISLRDKRDALKKKQSLEMEPITSRMQKVEAWLQNHLNTQNIRSLKSASGTAFLKEVSSATVEDREAFMNFVRENNLWEFLDSRCSKSVVDDYVQQTGNLPPGIKYSREEVCQVRRT
jgi:hypothetical protein